MGSFLGGAIKLFGASCDIRLRDRMRNAEIRERSMQLKTGAKADGHFVTVDETEAVHDRCSAEENLRRV